MEKSKEMIIKKKRRKIILNSISLLNNSGLKPVFSYNDECVICLCKCGIDSIVTECKHIFCYKCLEKWKETNDSTCCPICKNILNNNDRIVSLNGLEYSNLVDLFSSSKYSND